MNWVTETTRILWGLRAWTCFGLAVLFSLLVAILVPGLERRRRLVCASSRAAFSLAGVRVRVLGAEHLPDGNSVVVANHASYVDGVLLKGYLPPRFGFVIKGEMRNIPIVHFLLRRSGSKFVERKDRNGSARDARQIVRAAQDGESLGFFPEGTFRKTPGIGRFRPGAFVAAMKGKLPLVPIAIHGTREMLPSGKRLPRNVALTVDILPSIGTGDPAYADAKSLAEAARRQILAVLDEPDLLA